MVGDPTKDDLEEALDVLLWLHENVSDGTLRDEISHVRSELWNIAESKA